MAPVANNLTDVLFVDYVTGNTTSSQEHTFQVRFDSNISPQQDVQDVVAQLLGGWGTGAFAVNWRVIRTRVRQAGATFSFPVPIEASLQAFIGTYILEYSPRFEAVEDSIQGRSTTTGRRVDISIYRAANEADATFRYGMPAGVAAALSAGLVLDIFLTADGSAPIFYTYVNQNYNSYWERELRS